MRTSARTALLLILTLTATSGHAAVCWNLAPFDDVVKVSVKGAEGFFRLRGEWTSPSYHLPVIGSAGTNSLGEGFRLGLHGSNNDEQSFGGFANCVLDATVDALHEGPYTLACGGGGFGPLEGNLVIVPCDAEFTGRTSLGDL